jgi:hypothetical protein
MSGYSATPLAKKLGIAAGARLFLHQAPANYRELLAPLPAGVQTLPRIDAHTDVIHVFATRRAELDRMLRTALRAMRPDAALWVSWPKKAAWSGLKLVIRRTRRPAPAELARTRERS